MRLDDLRLVLIRYGPDTGLISLEAQTIVCHTVDRGDGGLEWPKDIALVDFSDESVFTRLIGQDPIEPTHNWDDVLKYVLDHQQELGLVAASPVTRRTTIAKDDIRTPLEEMLSRYRDSSGTDLNCAILDLLTELMHLCDDNEMDFARSVRVAMATYRQERTDTKGTS